jgi:hypothetical protein
VVVALGAVDLVWDPKRGRTAGRCLHIPPEGEEQGEAEDAEHAGAYIDVVLP